MPRSSLPISPKIRAARVSDIPELLRIEDNSFAGDRLTRRNFHYLLTKGKVSCLVEEEAGQIGGYAMLLFHAGIPLARLYSFAVDPERRKNGVGRALLDACERAARDHDCTHLRLEVRPDNDSAIHLYRRAGFREFDTVPDYYEDHEGALRMEKRLHLEPPPTLAPVPYYAQTLEFTCGPAALMMAMAALDPGVPLDRQTELRLWRESTTIFMTSGHGGSDPYGLGLAGHRRGFEVEIRVSDPNELFIDSVRSEEKKAVMRLVQQDFRKELAKTPVKIVHRRLKVAGMKRRLAQGAVPLVLISSYRFDRQKLPHWVTVTGADDSFVYAHDPFLGTDGERTVTDCMNMPIPHQNFESMSRYGRARLRAAVVLSRARAKH
ncbi:MAG: peptidase C39 family protein [Alphaproteobacteria bacterium]